jgi:hypothetical protein
VQQMVKVYKSRWRWFLTVPIHVPPEKQFQKDSEQMAAQGWHVAQQSSVPMTIRGTSRMTVTYQK